MAEIRNFESYPNNSDRAKEEAKMKEQAKIQRVANASIDSSKKNVAASFLMEGFHAVKDYAWKELLKPTLKRTALSLITNAADIMINGRVTQNPYQNGYNGGYYQGYNNGWRGSTSYGGYYGGYPDPRNEPPRYSNERPTNRFSHEFIVYPTIQEAESVLRTLANYIDKYGKASVNDLCDASGVSSNGQMDCHYGWRDSREVMHARIYPVFDGYKLEMPRAILID